MPPDSPRVPDRVALQKFYGLTDFDMKVLWLAARGCTVVETAQDTGYGPDMVKRSRKKIIETAYGYNNITGAVWWALEHGLLEPPEIWIPALHHFPEQGDT